MTFCTSNRQALLARPAVHNAFVAFCLQAGMGGIDVGRYVLMPDHVHLFVAIGNGNDLSSGVKSLKNSLSKCRRGEGCSSPRWQKGFFDHVLRSGESYEEKWEYVRAHPIRAGLIPEDGEWPDQGTVNPLAS
ncbi:MAG TPA: transposase [Lacunisphaera sp.]|nr:transposase [Lacunisphaera sp.]